MLNPASPTSAACLDPTPVNLCYPPRQADYNYFETPAYQPGEPPKVSLSRAADASMLAYMRFVKQRMAPGDLSGILAAAGYPAANTTTIGDCFVDGAAMGRGYFAWNDSNALLAFRGTEADDPNDMIADAELDRTPEAGGLVHYGFKRYLDSIWGLVAPLVAGYRAAHPARNICITGHSLGAALATLAFVRLKDANTSLITFGCPRVGNSNYCDVIGTMSRTRPCYRAVDNLDFVTHIPFDFLGFYAHPPVAVCFLDENHQLHLNPPVQPQDRDIIPQIPPGFQLTHWLEWLPTPLPRTLADHSPVRYCQFLGLAI